MHPGTIAIILAAAMAHAIWNLASKYKRGNTVLFVWAYTSTSTVLCVPITIVLILAGVQQLSWQLLLGAFVSAVFHLAYSLTLQAGYDRAELGVVYPIARGTGPILTMLLAILLLGEHPTLTAGIGALAVIAGILVVAGNPFTRQRRNPLRGVLWGTITGASIAGYTLWDSYVISMPSHLRFLHYRKVLFLCKLRLQCRRHYP